MSQRPPCPPSVQRLSTGQASPQPTPFEIRDNAIIEALHKHLAVDHVEGVRHYQGRLCEAYRPYIGTLVGKYIPKRMSRRTRSLRNYIAYYVDLPRPFYHYEKVEVPREEVQGLRKQRVKVRADLGAGLEQGH